MHTTKTKQLPKISNRNLFNKGWDILIQQLGYTKAIRFVMEFPSLKGDSVAEIRKLRKNWATVNQLDRDIKSFKKQK